MQVFLSRVLTIALASALAGCGSQGEQQTGTAASSAPAAAETKPPPAPAASAVDGVAEYASRCATCHGDQGDGKGPGGMALQPPPRDFRDAAWQASVTDKQIEQVIAYGGVALGKSPMMPAQPDLGSRPDALAAVRTVVRGFRE